MDLSMMSTFTAISVLAFSTQVWGHGNMFFPVPWPNQLANGRTLPDWTEVPRKFQRRALKFRGPLYPQPDAVCEGGRWSGCSGSSVQGGAKEWFTNHTFIPGEPTIPDDMYHATSYAKIQALKRLKHPWTSPGTAPTFGEGCGASGGNPNGCQCKEEGPVNFCYGNEERPYGSCCAQTDYGIPRVDGCGGFAYGKSAMEHAADGLFDNAAVTKWERGKAAEVLWKSGAGHKGGYAYRLCKVPAAGISGVTEQCFQNGHLNFDGPYTWVTNNARGTNFVQEAAVRTTDINGSQWTKINIPRAGDAEWFWKDRVQVPQSLETGPYVLSFRWDCENTPQVWNSCANIEIV